MRIIMALEVVVLNDIRDEDVFVRKCRCGIETDADEFRILIYL